MTGDAPICKRDGDPNDPAQLCQISTVFAPQIPNKLFQRLKKFSMKILSLAINRFSTRCFSVNPLPAGPYESTWHCGMPERCPPSQDPHDDPLALPVLFISIRDKLRDAEMIEDGFVACGTAEYGG
jgi:hypothetical protein